jgi:hypothetical protein
MLNKKIILLIFVMTSLVLGVEQEVKFNEDDITPKALFISQPIISQKNLPLRIHTSLVKKSRNVLVDFKMLGGKGNTYKGPSKRITLELFGGESITIVRERIKNFRLGGYIWVGTVEGVEHSQAIFSVKGGILNGKIAMPHAIYEIRNIKDNIYSIQELNHSKFPQELEPLHSHEKPVSIKNNIIIPNILYPEDCTQITVLVAYSTAAKNAAGGQAQIESLINLAVEETNQGYINSGVSARINLVHTMETNEAIDDFSDDLSALEDTTDGVFDTIDTARDTYNADLVALIIENGSSCGLASDVVVQEANAFSVTHRTCATGYYSFGHEIGHNMGAEHDWYVPVGDRTTSAKGYVNVTENWRTIMGYNTVCDDQGQNCTRLQYWSNPDITFNGDPMGVAGSSPTNCTEASLTPDPATCVADNRQQLNNACLTVANYRLGTHTAPVVLSPIPEDSSSVSEGESGQLLRVGVGDAESGIFYYDDDELISFSTTGSISNGFMEVTIPYEVNKMKNNGTNYWYVEVSNSHGTTRYPSSGTMSFTVIPRPVISNPSPMHQSTVIENELGQVLSVDVTGATAGTFYYDNDIDISYSANALMGQGKMFVSLPYKSKEMDNNGTNFWYMEASGPGGTTRYPSSGSFSFIVTPLSPLPVISNPSPNDGDTVTEGASGQLLSIDVGDATDGAFYYDDDSVIDHSILGVIKNGKMSATIPYTTGKMKNNGTNYWYAQAANADGIVRYPTSGHLSFTVTPLPRPPLMSNPVPVDASTVEEGASGQLLRISVGDATSGKIYYDDDADISFSQVGTIISGYMEITVPYVNGEMNDNGTNYWYAEATNADGTTRYPSSGNLSFTVTRNPLAPVVSTPIPFDGATVTKGDSGQVLRIAVGDATSGRIYYDDDNTAIDYSLPGTIDSGFMEVTVPYAKGIMDDNGTNYWYVEATNEHATSRYPDTGTMSFTVTPTPIPATSNPIVPIIFLLN